MRPPVLFPDAQALVVDHLRYGLAARGITATVGTRVPRPRPPNLVRVLRTGGVARDILTDVAQITVEAWAPADETAHDIAQTCRALLLALPGGLLGSTPVYSVAELGGPQSLPDPETDSPRFTFTHLIALRGTHL